MEANLTEVKSYCKYNFNMLESDIEKTVKLIAYLVLGGFGILANVFIIVLAVKYTVTKRLHFLIVNMSIADTLAIFFQFFYFVMNGYLYDSIWDDLNESIGQIMCKTLIFLYYVYLTGSLVILLVISIERYRITRQTVQISRPLSGKRRMRIIAFCWIVPIVLNLQLLISAQIEMIDSERVCIPITALEIKIWQATLLYITFQLVLFYYIAIVVLSILTLRRISKPQAIEQSLSEVQRQQRRNRIRNAVKVVLYSLLLYSCCYLPFVISLLVWFLINYCIDWSNLSFFAWYVLPLVNSCLSPCIYCVCLSDFRQAAKDQLRRLLCCGPNPDNLERRNPVVPSGRGIENTHL